MREFSGRAAVITGAGSGIGAALARRFARAGMKIVVADIDFCAAGRGAPIGVTMLIPGLVATRIYESERNRPERLMPEGGAAAETPELQAIAASLYAGALSPDDAAEQTYAAVCENRLYAFTTGSFDDAIRERAEAILARRNPVFQDVLSMSRRDSRAGGQR